MNDGGIQFSLEVGAAMMVQQHAHVMSADQRRALAGGLGDFAECLQGAHQDEQQLCDLGRILFQQLFPPTLREQLRHLDGPLTIVTNDTSLPWEVLHDEREFLSLRVPLARKLVLSKDLGRFLVPRLPARQEGFSALVIADPELNLPGAQREGVALHADFSRRGTSELLVGGDASFIRVQRSLIARPYSVIHYCGHVRHDEVTGTSSLCLSDGELGPHEISEVFRGTPVVFINACYSGSPPSFANTLARPGSLAEAFIVGNELGVAQAVVGAMWSIADEPENAALEFARAFFKRLFSGDAVGEALRTSRLMARERRWGPTIWGPYVLYGDPMRAPFAGPIGGEDGTPAEVAVSRQEKRRPLEALERALPLSTVARRIFTTAMREVTQAKQAGIGTMHILIGVCEARLPVLEKVFEETGTGRDAVSEEARKCSQRLCASADDDALGISLNGASTLKHAMQRAVALGSDVVSGEDILVGLLQCEDGTAVTILEDHDISRTLLLQRLAPLRVGSLAQEDCTPAGWQVLMDAVCIARARGEYVGTPHLFGGLLTDKQGALAKACIRLGADVGQLRRTFCVAAAEAVPCEASGIFKVSGNVQKILSRARADAVENRAGGVAPADLLAAFVAEGGGETGRALRLRGLMLEALSSSLFGEDGKLDLARFAESAREALSRAVECARRKGVESVGCGHLLHGLLLAGNGELPRRLHGQQQDAERLADLLFTHMPAGPAANPSLALAASGLAPDLLQALAMAETESRSAGEPLITEGPLLHSCLKSGGDAAMYLVDQGVRWNRLF